MSVQRGAGERGNAPQGKTFGLGSWRERREARSTISVDPKPEKGGFGQTQLDSG